MAETVTENEPLRQIRAAGYEAYLSDILLTERTVDAKANLVLVERLCCDPNFKQGIFHRLHKHVGPNRTEFRSLRGQFGEGSLQIVVSRETCVLYADCDGWNVYEDLVGVFGHAVGEVAWPKLKGVGRKFKKWFT